MRTVSIFGLMVVLTATVPAAARAGGAVDVLCFGDSTTLWGGGNGPPRGDGLSDGFDWPAQLAAARPDLAPRNLGRPLENTISGARRLASVLRARPCRAGECRVVILAGMNDPYASRRFDRASPPATAQRLLRMGRTALRYGYRPLVLTPLPTLGRGSVDLDWLAFGDEVAALVLRRGRSPRWRRVDVADLRAEFPLEEWRTLSADGIHPTAVEARARIAAFVSRSLR